GRIPGLRQKTAGVSHERGQRPKIEQFATVRLSQHGMRNAKIVRQALPVDLIGMLTREHSQLLGRGSPGTRFSGVSALKFGRQIERVRGRHSWEYLCRVAGQ